MSGTLQGTGGYKGSAVDLSQVQAYIKESWSQETRMFRDAKFGALETCHKVYFTGKLGDVIHVPNIGRLAVYQKQPQTPVTLQTWTGSEYTLTITRHMESSFMIEDMAEMLAFITRQPYVQESGYALKRDMDNFVLAHRAVINSFPSQRIFVLNDGTLNDGTLDAHYTGTPGPITYGAILLAYQKIMEADLDTDNLVLMVSPAQYADLLAINQFISVDFANTKPITTGKVGSILGIDVMMTSQITINSLTGYQNGPLAPLRPTPGVLNSPYYPDQVTATNAVATSDARDITLPQLPARGLPVYSGVGATAADGGQTLGLFGGVNRWATAMLANKDWLAFGVLQDVKVETSRETLYLADAFVSSDVYGAKVYRPDHAVVIHTSAI